MNAINYFYYFAFKFSLLAAVAVIGPTIGAVTPDDARTLLLVGMWSGIAGVVFLGLHFLTARER